MPQYKYTKEILEDAVKRSTNLKGVLRLIGATSTGSIRRHIRNRLAKFCISTSHFTNCPDIVPRSMAKLPIEETLKYNDRDYREKGAKLVEALILLGRPHHCERCKNNGEWCGEKLVLQVHHKDYDWHNNRPENLMFLCPNCHTQLDKKKSKKVNYCQCGAKITREAITCVKCLPRSEISSKTWQKKKSL